MEILFVPEIPRCKIQEQEWRTARKTAGAAHQTRFINNSSSYVDLKSGQKTVNLFTSDAPVMLASLHRRPNRTGLQKMAV